MAGAALLLALSACTSTPGDPAPRNDPKGQPTDTSTPVADPTPVLDPLGRPLRTDAQNRAYGVRLADRLRALVRARAPQGARRVSAGATGPLRKLNTFSVSGLGHSIRRSAFFLVPGDAHELARWYVRHPFRGWVADGAKASDPESGVGGGSLANGGWSYDVFYYRPNSDANPASAGVEVQTTQLSLGAAVRVTIFVDWLPARPLESFVSEVDRVTFRKFSGKRPYGSPVREEQVTSAAQVRSLSDSFNALPGTAGYFGSCLPLYEGWPRYVVVFRTATGPVRVEQRRTCGGEWQVRRSGVTVPPLLAHSERWEDLVRSLKS